MNRPLVVLGLNPGTRYTGVAVFYGPHLHDWRVRATGDGSSRARGNTAKDMVSALIERHTPHVLAIKKRHPSRSSAELRRLEDSITGLSRRSGLLVRRYTIDELKAAFAPGMPINKRDLARVIASRYPDLQIELRREEQSRNPYYIRRFEAVAVASLCYYELE